MNKAVVKALEKEGWKVRDATPTELRVLGFEGSGKVAIKGDEYVLSVTVSKRITLTEDRKELKERDIIPWAQLSIMEAEG